MTLNDDVLSAYLDGELSADEMARVAAALANDPAAQARLAAFRRVQALVGAADVKALAPAPASLAEALRAAPVGGKARGGWFDGMRAAAEALFALPRPALAAFALLLVGVGALAFAVARFVPDDGGALLIAANDVSARSALSGALDRVASGEGVDAVGGHITLVATFRDGDGRYCREYDYGAAAPGTARVTGIACRADGAWRVDVAVLTRGEAALAGYVPASDEAHRAVETLVRTREMGAPVSAADEAQAIARGWE